MNALTWRILFQARLVIKIAEVEPSVPVAEPETVRCYGKINSVALRILDAVPIRMFFVMQSIPCLVSKVWYSVEYRGYHLGGRYIYPNSLNQQLTASVYNLLCTLQNSKHC